MSTNQPVSVDSLSGLKKRAKALLTLIQARDQNALAWLVQHHPVVARLAKNDVTDFGTIALHDVLWALAREHGFRSWRHLRRERLAPLHAIAGQLPPSVPTKTPDLDDVEAVRRRIEELRRVEADPQVDPPARLMAENEALRLLLAATLDSERVLNDAQNEVDDTVRRICSDHHRVCAERDAALKREGYARKVVNAFVRNTPETEHLGRYSATYSCGQPAWLAAIDVGEGHIVTGESGEPFFAIQKAVVELWRAQGIRKDGEPYQRKPKVGPLKTAAEVVTKCPRCGRDDVMWSVRGQKGTRAESAPLPPRGDPRWLGLCSDCGFTFTPAGEKVRT